MGNSGAGEVVQGVVADVAIGRVVHLARGGEVVESAGGAAEVQCTRAGEHFQFSVGEQYVQHRGRAGCDSVSGLLHRSLHEPYGVEGGADGVRLDRHETQGVRASLRVTAGG